MNLHPRSLWLVLALLPSWPTPAPGDPTGSGISANPAAPAPSAPPPIEKLSATEFRLGEIRFRKDTRQIRFPATVNLDDELLEYAIVHERGKTHESLLSTTASPYHLQVVLLLCGYKPGLGDLFDQFAENPNLGEGPARTAPGAEKREKQKPDGLLVSVEWKDGTEDKRARLEDWFLSRANGNAMPRTAWSYTGSAIIDTNFQAEVEGSIFAVYLDELALANHPGPGNDDDALWIPFKEKMPPLKSSVSVVIEPAQPKTTEPR